MHLSFLSTLYPFRGGIAQYNACLYRALEKNGHSVNAFTFTTQYPPLLFPGKSQYVGERDSSDKIPSHRILSTVNPITWFTTPGKILSCNPEVLIMKYWMPFFAPSLGTVAKMVKKKTKVIAILDNVIPHERRTGDISLTKFFLRQCHGFVVMSETVEKDLLLLKPDAKYLFHPHPLYDHFGKKTENIAARQKLKIPSDKKILLFFGFIRNYKGLDLLLEAVKTLPDDYLLVVAGEVYGSFSEYDEIIKKNNLNEKVKLFIRYIPDDEVPLFFSAADVCVLPYRSATQSGITAIAFHFEVPVIATSVGGLAEIIKDGETGMLIGKPQPGLITKSILDFFEKRNRERMIKNIQALKEKLSWEHFADEMVAFSCAL